MVLWQNFHFFRSLQRQQRRQHDSLRPNKGSPRLAQKTNTATWLKDIYSINLFFLVFALRLTNPSVSPSAFLAHSFVSRHLLFPLSPLNYTTGGDDRTFFEQDNSILTVDQAPGTFGFGLDGWNAHTELREFLYQKYIYQDERID